MSLELETFQLAANDWVPNNPRLPVLVYRQVVEPDANDPCSWFESLFARHGWPPQWRDGIFDYHHYHSTAHEVLGVATGKATVVLGGPGGMTVAVEAGDVLVLPAGTGHCLKHADDAFEVVGAYPAGQDWDIQRAALSAQALRKMLGLDVPAQDPVAGGQGALVALWGAVGKKAM